MRQFRKIAPFVLCACASEDPEIRQADVVAWRRVPVVELERHPLFSTVPVTKKPISDGSELWDYLTCTRVKEDRECSAGPGVFGGVYAKCTGGEDQTFCCHNQFLIRGDMVEEFRLVGRCKTNCLKRPGGACP